MTEISLAAFMQLAGGRAGHFCMESGLHSALWLDLDALFASPTGIEPFVSALADKLRPFSVDAVCGPLLGGAFLAQRIAQMIGAEFWFTQPAAPADGPGLYRARYHLPPAFTNRLSRPHLALVDDVMSAGSSLRASYAELQSRTDVVHQAFETWLPADCPHCAAGVPLESVLAPRA